jgi:alkylation response protein AidB-like acyl-CoA dehydrogenase
MQSPSISPDAEKKMAWIRDYIPNRVNFLLMDERRCIPPYVVSDFARQGLLSMCIPKEYGGQPLSNFETYSICSQVGYFDVALASFFGVNNSLGIRPIARFGTAETKEEFLPHLARGGMMAGLAITEPDFGSNLGGIQASCELTSGGRWRISGEKKWIGNAGWAGVLNVLARNKADSSFQLFSVYTDAPGVTQGKEELTMGMKAMIQNTVFLNDVEVDAKFRLGAGSANKVIADTFNYSRAQLMAVCVGTVRRCLATAYSYASKRSINTGLLFQNGVVQSYFENSLLKLNAMETYINHMGWLLDKTDMIPEELAITAKYIGSDWGWSIIDMTIQILGGRGFIETNNISRFLRDERVFRIFEGPNESLLCYLGQKTLNYRGMNLAKILKDELSQPQYCAQIEDLCVQLEEKIKASQMSAQEQNLLHYYLGLYCTELLFSAVFNKAHVVDDPLAGAVKEKLSERVKLHYENLSVDLKKFTKLRLSSEKVASILSDCEKHGSLSSHHPGVLCEIDRMLYP